MSSMLRPLMLLNKRERTQPSRARSSPIITGNSIYSRHIINDITVFYSMENPTLGHISHVSMSWS